MAKGLGIVGGFVAIFFGILGMISLDPKCLFAMLLQLYVLFYLFITNCPNGFAALP